MKRLWIAFSVFALCAALTGCAFAQGNPRGKSEVTAGAAKVSVEYGRPSLHGRSIQDMLGKLAAGEVWRLGADKSTTFTTSADLDFGGTTVPKGVYSLWAQKQADNTWKLVFNSQHGQWGTDHDASKDAVAVPLTQGNAGSAADQVAIKLDKEGDGAKITISWGDLELSTNFKAK